MPLVKSKEGSFTFLIFLPCREWASCIWAFPCGPLQEHLKRCSVWSRDTANFGGLPFWDTHFDGLWGAQVVSAKKMAEEFRVTCWLYPLFGRTIRSFIAKR